REQLNPRGRLFGLGRRRNRARRAPAPGGTRCPPGSPGPLPASPVVSIAKMPGVRAAVGRAAGGCRGCWRSAGWAGGGGGGGGWVRGVLAFGVVGRVGWW